MSPLQRLLIDLVALIAVIFTRSRCVSLVQTISACDRTGTPSFPLLDHAGVGLLDDAPEPSQRLAPPVAQLRNSCIDD